MVVVVEAIRLMMSKHIALVVKRLGMFNVSYEVQGKCYRCESSELRFM